MAIWYLMHPAMKPEMLGLIPDFIHDDDPRPAARQIDERYAHGGGWRPMPGWRFIPTDQSLQYLKGDDGPEDPMPVLARCRFRDELICFYPHAWVAIIQPDDSFEVSRMD